jgi:hypothetical protein
VELGCGVAIAAGVQLDPSPAGVQLASVRSSTLSISTPLLTPASSMVSPPVGMLAETVLDGFPLA